MVLNQPPDTGEIVWGRMKRDAWGRSRESDRPANEWVVTKVEHVRIVGDWLWASAHWALQNKQRVFAFKRSGAVCSKSLMVDMSERGNRSGLVCRFEVEG